MSKTLNSSEAIYAFAGWLTSRKERTIMSSTDDIAPIANLIDQFCKINNLPKVSNANIVELVSNYFLKSE